jgi:hypothetical protein
VAERYVVVGHGKAEDGVNEFGSMPPAGLRSVASRMGQNRVQLVWIDGGGLPRLNIASGGLLRVLVFFGRFFLQRVIHRDPVWATGSELQGGWIEH